MQTIDDQKKLISKTTFGPAPTPDSVSSGESKKLKIREFIYWSACFAVISGITGLMKILQVAITMEAITSTLFYLSVAGLVFFISRIIVISRAPASFKGNSRHDLN